MGEKRFWTYIFLILLKSIPMRFFRIFENKTILFKIFIIFEHIMSQTSTTHKKINCFSLYLFQKSPYSMFLFRIYSQICNTTPIQFGCFFCTSLLYSLQAAPKMHCLCLCRSATKRAVHVTLAEFKSLVIDTKSNSKSITNRFQFIVITWVCIFGKCLLSCLFINTEYLDARFVTNYKTPTRILLILSDINFCK